MSDLTEKQRDELPTNKLPSWNECMIRVDNEKYLNDNNLENDDYYCDALLPNELHRFIYEYDDADPVRSAWFLHRLDKLIDFIKLEERENSFLNQSQTTNEVKK